MKKLFVIILIFCAAGAYSQARNNPIEITGQVYGGFNLLVGSTDEYDETVMGGLNTGKGQIEAKGEKDKFGGWLRLGYEFEKEWFGDFDVWWRESEKFAFYITYNEDGHFPLDKIAGYNFFGFPGEVLGLTGCASSRAFYSGFTRGSFISVNPVKELEINWGLNVFNPDEAEFMFKSMTLQVAYNIAFDAKIGLTYEGDYMTDESLDDNPALSLYFNKGIKNVDIDLGIRYKFFDTREEGNIEQIRHHPVNFGAGIIIPVNKVTIKSRLHMSVLGYNKYGDEQEKYPTDIGIDVLPSYSFKENIKGYLNTGMYFSFPEEGDADFLWRVNPYIIIGDENAGAFYAGLAFFNDVFNQDTLHFSIPIGLSIKF